VIDGPWRSTGATIVARVNRRIDALARTTVVVGGRPVPAFRLCGTVGFALGVAAGAGLAAAHGRSPWLVAALGGVAAVTFTVLSAVARGPDGDEQLVYYHHQLAVLATTIATLLLAGAPVLPYLDAVAVGLGVFLVLGRVGCLMVGCCHGRPARVGICYGPAHVREGFPAHRAGVRLVPVPALESAWTLVSVGVAVAASWQGPGAGVAAYIVTYAAGRFVLEYARGDGARPYLLAISEGQWTSLALVGAVVTAELAGVVATDPVHAVALALLAVAAAATLLAGLLRRGSDCVLLTPRHLEEVAWTVAHLAGRAGVDGRLAPVLGPVPSAVHVAATSQGLSISASTLVGADAAVHHFALSRAGGLTPETAAALGQVLCVLTGDEPQPVLRSRGGDVFHLTVAHRSGRL
jgi:hypothetical protein